MSPRDEVFSVPNHVVSEVLDGETVILNLHTGKYFALNRTATRMWQLLREHRTLAEVCTTVAAEFATDRGRVEADLDGLMASLKQRGLIEGG